MSTLTGLISSGGGGSVIKSIQRGVTAVGSTDTSVNVTISAVTTSKAFVSFCGSQVYNGADNRQCFVNVNLTASTTLQISRGLSGSVNNVSWEVIEYE